MHLGIIYRAGKVKLLLYKPIEYTDSNYAEDLEDCKSMIGYCFFVNRVVVSWCSKKQQTISTSTIEAKYIALGHAMQESIWIKRFLNELKMSDPINTCILYGDNETNIIFTKNAKSQTWTKHINI